MKLFYRLLCGIYILALAGCANTSFSKTQLQVQDVSLPGKQLYIYSFLDIREETFGPRMLDELDAQLINSLKNSGVSAKLLRYKDSEDGSYFASTASTLNSPVVATITRNVSNERKSGAQYRLTIEPTNVVLHGAWRNYEIRWTLSSTDRGALIWTTVAVGKHLNLVKSDEDPESRAKKIVDGVIQEMRASKLL